MDRKQKIALLDQGYNITVTGRHLHVTDAMKDYAIEKMSKIEKIAPRIIDVAITMDIQKLDNKVDIIMKYGPILIKSHAKSTDMYVSIDMAIDKLDSQLRKYKSRIHDYHAKGHAQEERRATIYRIEDEIDEEEANAKIEKEVKKKSDEIMHPHREVKKISTALHILTDDEALMKMELSQGHDPMIIYRNEIDRKLKAIYRQEDGAYVIVDVEQ